MTNNKPSQNALGTTTESKIYGDQYSLQNFFEDGNGNSGTIIPEHYVRMINELFSPLPAEKLDINLNT